jgi:phosphoribosylformimino-5-aminoimidazole carboxamide ribotide isomerase
MELYPALDIRSGRVARVSRTGDAAETVYHSDPFAVAAAYARGGARWIHVVDLDRALGRGDQSPLIAELVRSAGVPAQVGGGLCREEDVDRVLSWGARRVVLGSSVARTVEEVAGFAARFGAERLALAIDVRDGRAWSREWPEASRLTPLELARRAAAGGLSMVTHTELSREGALLGADVDGARVLSTGAAVKVVVSGGVNGLEDLLRCRDAGLAGVIVGRALLEGRFTLAEALACLSS